MSITPTGEALTDLIDAADSILDAMDGVEQAERDAVDQTVEQIEAVDSASDYLRECSVTLRAAVDRAAIAAFSTHPSAPVAPAGWKLVPVEPTQEMVAAYLTANDAYWKRVDDFGPPPIGIWRDGSPSAATAESYRAMLAATPSAEAQPTPKEN